MSNRGTFTLGGWGRQTPAGGNNNAPGARAPTDTNKHSWERVADQDDASAPNVAGQFGRQQGESIHGELQREQTMFSLGGIEATQGPPTHITQYGGEGQGVDVATTVVRNESAATEQGVAGASHQTAQRAPREKGPYSGMAAAIKKWGIGDANTQANELRWQQGVRGDKNKIEQFRDIVGALQDFKTYLFMKPGSAFCTVVHSPMKFVAITAATQQLQGRIIGFVGD